MAFTLPDGKVARTLTEQVKFLTEKLKDLYAEVNRLGFKIVIVDGALPLEGEPRTLYLVEMTPPDTDNYYEEYIWINDAWEMIGTTQVDLTNYVTLDGAQDITGVKTIADTSAANSPKLQFQNQYTTLGLFANGYQLKTDSPLYISGNNTVEGNIVPEANGTRDLGTSSYAWKDLHLSGNVDFGDSAIIHKDSSNRICIKYSGTDKIKVGGSGSYIDGFWAPDTNIAYDLGRSALKWRSLYTNGVDIDGENGTFKTGYTIEPKSDNGCSLGKSNVRFSEINVGKVQNNFAVLQLISGSDISAEVGFQKSFRPSTNAGADLGSATYKWNSLYLAGNLSDGTNTATVEDIAALITYAKAQGWIS